MSTVSTVSTVSAVHSAVIPPSMMVSFHQVTCLDNFSSLFHIFHIIFNNFCDTRKEKASHIFLVSWFHFTFSSVTSIPVSAYLNFPPFLFVAYGEEWGEWLLLAYLCQFLFDVLLSTFLIPIAGNLFCHFALFYSASISLTCEVPLVFFWSADFFARFLFIALPPYPHIKPLWHLLDLSFLNFWTLLRSFFYSNLAFFRICPLVIIVTDQ